MSLFVGRLSQDARPRDLEDVFGKYGRITRCDVKMGYGFVEYEDRRDAEDAMKNCDGMSVCGGRIAVEWAKGPGAGRRGGPGNECFRCGREGHWARDCPDGSSGGDRYGRPSGSAYDRDRRDYRDYRDVRDHRDYSRSRYRSRSPRREYRDERRDDRYRRRSRSDSRDRRDRVPSRRYDDAPRDRRDRSRSPAPAAVNNHLGRSSRSPSPPPANRSRSHSASPARARSPSPQRYSEPQE